MTAGRGRVARGIAIVVLAALGMSASAGSNLAGDGYPAPACGERPAVPGRPETFETVEAIDAYNAKVDAYNTSMERFVACLRDYLVNAADDVRWIRRLSREAIERVNQ